MSRLNNSLLSRQIFNTKVMQDNTEYELGEMVKGTSLTTWPLEFVGTGGEREDQFNKMAVRVQSHNILRRCCLL
jgi:hypothetical protein